MKILLIEDDKETAATIKEELASSYIVEISYTGVEGEYQAQINDYDIIILDYVLPDIDGVTVCRKLRESSIQTPIMILSGKYAPVDKVRALDAGADDYVTKPFNFEELQARIKALLRRQSQKYGINILPVGDLVLDLDKKVVTRGSCPILLRRKEFDLLEYLVRNTGKVVTRSMIINHVWDSAYDAMTNVVDVHIKYLRDHIDKPFEKKLIKTIHGLGYKIEA